MSCRERKGYMDFWKGGARRKRPLLLLLLLLPLLLLPAGLRGLVGPLVGRAAAAKEAKEAAKEGWRETKRSYDVVCDLPRLRVGGDGGDGATGVTSATILETLRALGNTPVLLEGVLEEK